MTEFRPATDIAISKLFPEKALNLYLIAGIIASQERKWHGSVLKLRIGDL